MEITYEFADGTRSEAEVDEELGKEILESRRKEENLERKERYHSAYSLDGCEYEGEDFAFEADPLTELMKKEHRIDLGEISEVQRRRLLMKAEGLSTREIARKEGVDQKAVMKSLKQGRKIFSEN